MKHHNFAHYWCAVMVEGVIRRGIDHFFIAPGSRSTPLVSALARNHKAKIFLGIDERSIGFMALGYSKAAKKPGVIIVTSGTAVANLYPAVTEAFLSHVPMLVLTADRPYELRDCGANQTMFQAGMFGNHVNKSFDMAPPSSVVSLEMSWATFAQSIRASLRPKKGPVHINLQFREPVANLSHPGEPAWDVCECFEYRDLDAGIESGVHIEKLPDIFSAQKGLLAVGEMLPKNTLEQILALSEKLSWPIFADVTSNLRLSKHPNIMHHFDLALLNHAFVNDFKPEVVVKLGGRIVSKRFWSWIEKISACKLVSMSDSPERIDHVGRFAHWYVTDEQLVLQDIIQRINTHRPKPWLTSALYQSLTRRIENFLETNRNNEAYYSARLVASISEPTNLFLSSSMPIRDIDQFAQPTHVPIDVYANRGASGIDGVTSSAIGVAAATNKPTILLIGDVAFVHDTNGLMLLKTINVPILIVVFNNGGGGIFHFLPIAKEQDVITPYLDTPHQVSIKHVCQAHQIAHNVINDAVNFADAVKRFYQERTTVVLEVMIDRDENVRTHQMMYQVLQG